jgi:hypothetical protein
MRLKRRWWRPQSFTNHRTVPRYEKNNNPNNTRTCLHTGYIASTYDECGDIIRYGVWCARMAHPKLPMYTNTPSL